MKPPVLAIFIITLAPILGKLQNYGHSHQQQQPFYGNFKLVRLDTRGLGHLEDLFKFLSPRVDYWTNPAYNSSVDFMVSPREYRNVERYFRQHRVEYQVLMRDVQHEIDSQMRRVDTNVIPDSASDRVGNSGWRRQGNGPFSRLFSILMRPFDYIYQNPSRQSFEGSSPPRKHRKFRKGHPMNWDNYQRLNVINEYMFYLEDNYPQLAKVIDIGPSVQKRRMRVLKIGSKKYSDKPAIFIEAGIHAREWISPATATFLMRELVENYAENMDILDFYDFYILPVANPDGYEYSFWGNRLWRKNRASNGGLAALLVANCNGVDLNRNFGYHWSDVSTLNPQGGTQLNCIETYSGPFPFSEPESRNIAKFVTSIRTNLVSYLMIHSYGQKVLYPWSYTEERIPDWRDLQIMGELVASEIEAASGRSYSVGSSPHIQYFASGGSDDWARGSMGIKWVFLFELPDKGSRGFLLPPEEIKPTAFSIYRGIRALAVQISRTLVY